jgi:hypothetical protein
LAIFLAKASPAKSFALKLAQKVSQSAWSCASAYLLESERSLMRTVWLVRGTADCDKKTQAHEGR